MQSMSENDFECFASTGVNTPVAMSPNFGCREVQLSRSRLLDRVGHIDGLRVIRTCAAVVEIREPGCAFTLVDYIYRERTSFPA